MSSTIRLRPTTELDLDYILSTERHPDNCNYVYQWNELQHRAALSDPNQRHWLIEDRSSAERVGYCLLDDVQNTSHSINLRRLVVSRKGHGIGREALYLLQASAFEELGAHRLWLDVFSDNPRAHQLYQQVGFRDEGLLRESYLRNGNYASQYLMAILAHEFQPRI